MKGMNAPIRDAAELASSPSAPCQRQPYSDFCHHRLVFEPPRNEIIHYVLLCVVSLVQYCI